MSTSFRLVLHPVTYMEMLAQAQAELPNECCGLLAGKVIESSRGPIGHVERRYPLVNAAASPREYRANSKELFAVHRDMRPLGIDILAIYHSHPTTEPVPSKTDLELSTGVCQLYGPHTQFLIISLRKSEPEVRGWHLREAEFGEAEWELAGT